MTPFTRSSQAGLRRPAASCRHSDNPQPSILPRGVSPVGPMLGSQFRDKHTRTHVCHCVYVSAEMKSKAPNRGKTQRWRVPGRGQHMAPEQPANVEESHNNRPPARLLSLPPPSADVQLRTNTGTRADENAFAPRLK